MKGLFITFEGPDGAGKTTQLKRLAAKLQETGRDVIVTREPGGTSISDQIREVLLSPDNKKMTDQAEVLLYAASRAQHVHELIIPSLAQGKIVLCDRFIDASMAYQAYGLGIDEQFVRSVNHYASSGLQPNRTYLLDVPIEVSLARLSHRQSTVTGSELDRIEQKPADYHRKVREGFVRISEQNRERVCWVNASRGEEEIAGDIWSDCNRLLNHF
ncbi:dTMP kinase [Paenibacillus thalictri]|uniref:Thymidylate kinase n=1 Tax=Paenibacillus thalictri TaxID=2527873 RepID=A0A4Q9DE02_9BACL|nr:dTMP kinase [Paenibacillus thalictri]TBL68998.1 dTMP kinase [Paenibacillus thalictri]